METPVDFSTYIGLSVRPPKSIVVGVPAMPYQTTKIAGQLAGLPNGRSWLKAFIGLPLVALAGCFAAPAMHYDIQQYNKAALSSEKQMLLFNIGQLRDQQPPHFMMLSSVSQTRIFSASAGFQWANPATWIVPFAGSATENPTIQFVPIQGNDFVQRFESPTTDKLLYFVEENWWSDRSVVYKVLIPLFAQSLRISHGDATNGGSCRKGILKNDGTSGFLKCAEEIWQTPPNYEQIDGSYPVPTKASDQPKSADLVTALGAGYEWTSAGDLATRVSIPAWLDYTPTFVAPPESGNADSSIPVFWVEEEKGKLRWQKGMQYFLLEGYKWKAVKRNSRVAHSAEVYALLPDGYELARDENGDLKRANRDYVLKNIQPPTPHVATGTMTEDKPDLTSTNGLSIEDEGSSIYGPGIAVGTTVVKADASTHTATMSKNATGIHTGGTIVSTYRGHMIVGDKNEFSYADEVVHGVWPVQKDYLYIELRRNNKADDPKAPLVTDAVAERACFSQPKKGDQADEIVCGYLKIGNLLDIMQRLAYMACPYQDEKSIKEYCEQSIFGIGERVPPWADTFASYKHLNSVHVPGPYVYVPAHAPTAEPERADRDRKMFFYLYKLYQMSLVDTSRLVTGTPAITISK